MAVKRWTRESRPGKRRHALYLTIAGGMLLYGLFRLAQGGLAGTAGFFWAAWLLFAALIVAANAYTLFFMSEEKRVAFAAIKRAKAMQWERLLLRAMERGSAGRERGARSRQRNG